LTIYPFMIILEKDQKSLGFFINVKQQSNEMWTVYIMWFYKALKNRNSMPYSFVKTVHSKWVCLLLRALSWTPTEILIFFELQFYMKYITLNHIHILHYAYAIVCFQNKKYTNNIFSKTIQTLNFRCDCSQRNWYYRMRKTFTKQQFWTNYIMFFFCHIHKAPQGKLWQWITPIPENITSFNV